MLMKNQISFPVNQNFEGDTASGIQSQCFCLDPVTSALAWLAILTSSQ